MLPTSRIKLIKIQYHSLSISCNRLTEIARDGINNAKLYKPLRIADDTADNPDDHGGDHIVQNEHPELPARRPALKISILQFQHIQKILFHKLVILSGNT